jgi:Winged helix DNA-binding domain
VPLQPEPCLSVTWEKVSAFRLARQGLLEPNGNDPVAVCARLAGVHAQVMSCAELAIGLRTKGMPRTAVSDCLWEHRTLLKFWAMRGTLHLLPSDEIDLWSGALTSHRHYLREGWVGAFGLTSGDIAELIEIVRTSLDGRNLTRDELAAEMAPAIKNPLLLKYLRSGWGSLLKPASYSGYLCFGPNRGRNVTFTSLASVCGPFKPLDSTEAMKEVIRRHLNAYGPAAPARFAVWWGMRVSRTREVFESLSAELAVIDVEGWRGYILARDLAAIRDAPDVESVLLLGGFDPYTVAMCIYGQCLLPHEKYKSRVSRTRAGSLPSFS